jgi:hypothetical protein
MVDKDKISSSANSYKLIETKINNIDILANKCDARALLRQVKGAMKTLEEYASGGNITTSDYSLYDYKVDEVIDKFSKRCLCRQKTEAEGYKITEKCYKIGNIDVVRQE